MKIHECDFLIIGGGIAGLTAATQLGSKGKTILLTKGKTGETATEYAQGGIAAAIDEEKDSPLFHLKDTLEAGAGLCDPKAVEVLVHDGVEQVKELIGMGCRFDKIGESYELTLEGAHRHRRILHAGDATGAEIERTLAAWVLKQRLVEVRNFIFGEDLLIKDHTCFGARALDTEKGEDLTFLSQAVILATGGLGQIYLHNTNPIFATGDGVAMAYRAGAEVVDLEFIQFHPTTLHEENLPGQGLPHTSRMAGQGGHTRFLISEAIRGEGAVLLNHKGERFMPKYHEMAELAPRDIVTRAMVEEMEKTGTDYLFLSLAPIGAEKIKERFPTIYQGCLERGIDITKENIPVSPAAHYSMGGVKTDLNGKTKITGLYAAGEVAGVGIHGANRLASNSLLDGLVFGHRSAISAAEHVSKLKINPSTKLRVNAEQGRSIKTEKKLSKLKPEEIYELKQKIKETMWEKVGVIRSGEGLNSALKILSEIEGQLDFTPSSGDELELKNMILVAKLITRAALDRKESRGAHYRTDFPKQDDQNWKRHLVYKLS